MYYPTLADVRALQASEVNHTVDSSDARAPLLPICYDLLADMETPVSAYCKAARGPYSFLLESIEGGERIARYSFIGIHPYLVMRQRGETATLLHMRQHHAARDVPGDDAISIEEVACHDPLLFIQNELDRYRIVKPATLAHDELPRFPGGAVGYLAYESVARFERVPVPEQDDLGLPLAIFCFTETVLVFDHLKRRVRIITHLHLDAPDLEQEYRRVSGIIEDILHRLRQPAQLPAEPEPIEDEDALRVRSNRTPEEFEEMVRTGQEYIRAGDIFQVVLSQRLSRHVNAAPLTVYRALRAINPSPFLFFLDLDDIHIIGASPELLVRVEDSEVTIHPIAGTRKRGHDLASDRQLADELLHDPKERAEHIMLVDLGRNDVGRVSVPGSVHVTQLLEIERYSHVMHLVSNVVGQLRPDLTAYDALRSGFPAGTVSGAPKIRAMEIIAELEGTQRGVYAGAVGYFSLTGNLDTAIALRTMVMHNGHAYIQAGGGIVADSVPEEEYQESMNKARALLHALDEAEAIAQGEEGHAFTHR